MLIHEAQYGSDEAGLGCGYAFEREGCGRPLASTEAMELGASSGAGQPEGRFLWLHFNVSNAATEPWLRQHLELPDAFYESLHGSSPSTRVEQSGDALLAVL